MQDFWEGERAAVGNKQELLKRGSIGAEKSAEE